MTINEFFKYHGYDLTVHDAWAPYIELFKAWYKGKVNSFHNYKIYNGIKDIEKERLSLQTAKFVSEKMSDLLFNEKVNITLSDENSTKLLNEILENNKFAVLMNRGIEKSFAMGTGCVTVDIDNIKLINNAIDYSNAEVSINFINAENIYPLSWNENSIKELAVINTLSTSTGDDLCIIKLYLLDENNNYKIKSFKFYIDKRLEIIKEYEGAYIKEFNTGSKTPWFSIITPNIVNNIDLYSPYGISIFANSIDVLKGIDLVYDSLNNEISLGRKRLFTTKEVLRFNSTTGQQELNFDPNDIVFHIVGDGFSNDKEKYIQEINGELRIDEHIKSLDTQLRVLGAKTGFGSDYFSFSEKTLEPKTATQVVSENSELFRTIKKHEQLLYNAIRNIVKSISDIGILTGKFTINTSNINIDFDDSVIVSKDQERSDDREDLAQDTLSRVDYVMKWRGLDRNSAIQKIDEIDNEKPAKEGITFLDGEIN